MEERNKPEEQERLHSFHRTAKIQNLQLAAEKQGSHKRNSTFVRNTITYQECYSQFVDATTNSVVAEDKKSKRGRGLGKRTDKASDNPQ